MWYEVLKNFAWLVMELTVLFVVVSFVVNLLQGFVRYDKVEIWMKKTPPIVSALIAVVFAFITPFCSCSTIPVVVNLLKNKIRFSTVMIFLFTSPVLDPTILTVMVVLMGWEVALYYTVITTILSIILGFALERWGFEKEVKNVIIKNALQAEKRFSLKNTVSEILTLMKTVYPFLLIGAGIGAVIGGIVPTEFVATYLGGENWWLIPIAAIIGIPLYIRLSSMIPISQILIAKGMALGPVMAMMISSAGASLPELSLLNSIFKRKLVFAFVLSVFSMSTISGFLFYFI
ncbi:MULTISPECIES: permease [Bacillaceae]|uniref:permease n=1 Tax=Bacillaceae TaxID=186817 RepID=UPI001F198C18|nr:MULTISPECIES: permease [Bacillaceae]MCF2650426.1 permease [Niallia circulans]CAI9387174.1 Putative two-component membrane permease complex subunit SMU_747c [Bacillus sp. T2.9-1]